MDQQEDVLRHTTFWENLWEGLMLLLSGLGGLVLSALLAAWIMKSHPELTHTEGFTFVQCLGNAFVGGWTGQEATGFVVFAVLRLAYRASQKNEGFCNRTIQHHLSFGKSILETIQHKNIVLYPGMKIFDLTHVIAIEGLLTSGGGPVRTLYALDATDPPEWWTNDMLGYLALQARWSMQADRRLKRVFVWERSAIGSPPGKKLLQLHYMLGFETLICPDYVFFSDTVLRNNNTNEDRRREFVIWDDEDAATASVPTIGMNIYGYDSYWKTYDTQERRDKIWEDKKTEVATAFRPIVTSPDTTYRKLFASVETVACSNPRTAKILRLDATSVGEASSAIDAFVETLKKF